MNTTHSSTPGRAFGVVALLASLVGLLVAGYGVLLLPVSELGGAWIAAVGLSLLLAGLFTSERVRDRTNLSQATGRRLSRVDGELDRTQVAISARASG